MLDNDSVSAETDASQDPHAAAAGLVEDGAGEPARNDELLATAAALLDPEPAPSGGVVRPRTLGERAVALALTQRGFTEEPGGENRNPYSRYFGYGPQKWCADFVSWAVDRCGNRDHAVPWGYPSGVAGITAWARSTGRLKTAPASGDIFTYKNGGHTGFVVSVSGDRFRTIEGNTGGPDGRIAWVWGHTRRNDGTYHFVRAPE
jgi:hypothetical protein